MSVLSTPALLGSPSQSRKPRSDIGCQWLYWLNWQLVHDQPATVTTTTEGFERGQAQRVWLLTPMTHSCRSPPPPSCRAGRALLPGPGPAPSLGWTSLLCVGWFPRMKVRSPFPPFIRPAGQWGPPLEVILIFPPKCPLRGHQGL